MLLFLYNRSREIFNNGQETFVSLRFENQTQASAFMTIFSRSNIQPRLRSFDFFSSFVFFVYCFDGEVLYFLSGHFGESCRHVFESKNVTVFSVVMVTLLNHRSFFVIPLLRGNSDALNQSHLRNFSAYIIK